MKKYFVFSLLLVLVGLLAACGSYGESSTSSATSDGEENTYSWKAASHVPEDEPNTIALKEIAERVHEESDGRIDIKVYPANQLGDYTTVYEELGRGTIEMASISTPSQLDKRLELIYMPYLAKNYDDVEEMYSNGSFLFNELHDVHSNLGVKLLGLHAMGFGGIGTTEKIANPADNGEEKGLMIRVPQMHIFQQSMEDLGYRTVSIPYEDLYTALQTGSADGWSGGGITTNYIEFRDVIKYYYRTNDFFDASSIMMNEDIWNELSEEDQKMISGIVDDVSSKSIDIAEKNEEVYQTKLEEEGIEFIELSDEELESLSNYVRENSWPKLKERFGSEIIDGLTEE